MRIVIDYMKDRIDSKHLEAIDKMTKDWQKIKYLVREVLIPGSTEQYVCFEQVTVQTLRDLLYAALISE